MKKVGIITLHRTTNYGSVLQAYALKTSIEKYSPCNIINYETINGKRESSLSFKKNLAKNLIKRIAFRKKYKLFYDFINKNATNKITTPTIIVFFLPIFEPILPAGIAAAPEQTAKISIMNVASEVII